MSDVYINTAALLPVLYGDKPTVTIPCGGQSAARQARRRLSTLLYQAKLVHEPHISTKGLSLEPLRRAGVFIDPLDPTQVKISVNPPPVKGSAYAVALSLAVGQSYVFNPPRSATVDSIKSRLKDMAAKAEEELGVRPAWSVDWDRRHGVPNGYVITRLPDDHDPATGQQRDHLTGQRKADAVTKWNRYHRLSFDYDEAICLAEEADQPRPKAPQELIDLARELAPQELPYLLGEEAAS